MLTKTDERFVPWSDDLCTGGEHLHRYSLSKSYVRGKKVLDLACGEGYGSAMLAATAASVVGIDISEEAIKHAAETYKNHNISFITGKMTEVPIKENGTFDVIVCFEALEHIDTHEELLKEVKRLLKPDGIFIVSTPNKPVYSENGTRQNPFHLKELDLEDFQKLMKDNFKHLLCYGQKTYASSKIFPLEGPHSEVKEYVMKKESSGFTFANQNDPLPRYFIAIASDKQIEHVPGISYFTDITVRKGYVAWEIPIDPNLNKPSKLRSLCSKIKRRILKIF